MKHGSMGSWEAGRMSKGETSGVNLGLSFRFVGKKSLAAFYFSSQSARIILGPYLIHSLFFSLGFYHVSHVQLDMKRR
jgi:hypothetical protein